MESHPIPQNISSYQFRLVGDMTLKQFFQVAGGALVGLLFYSTGLPGIIKWFFIIISGLTGVALAFLPFEDRPLEKWILSFLRSVYSPTIFNWQKTTTPAVYFQETTTPVTEAPKAPLTTLDKNEFSFLTNIFKAIQFEPTKPVVVPPVPVAAPLPPTPVRVVAPSGNLVMPASPAVTSPVPNTKVVSIPAAPKPLIVVEESKPQTKTDKPLAGVTVADLAMGINFPGFSTSNVPSQPVQFSPEAAPPNPPTVPNTVTGQTLDESGKIIEGAIMEIRDAAGRPVRALKTNKLGHFIIVTPLINGKYEIITDKDGYTFEPAAFEVQGNIIQPILIKGKPVQTL